MEKKSSKGEAVYDYHIREILKYALKDVCFVMENMSKEQFDKISNSVRGDIVKLLSIFAKMRVDRSYLKHPYGRIKAYHLRAYTDLILKGEYAPSVLFDLAQESLDDICGKDIMYLCLMSKKAYLDYENYIKSKRISISTSG